jgi:hypothetical protein
MFSKIIRKNGPIRKYYNSGTLREEKWYHEGKLHRIDGPAYTYRYNENDQYAFQECYYLNNNVYDVMEYYNIIDFVKKFINRIRHRLRKQKEIDLYNLGFCRDISNQISSYIC